MFSKLAWEQFCSWANTDNQILDKILTLINDIKRDPFKGLGKPEPLKHGKAGYWSRRITANKQDSDRLTYRVIGKDSEKAIQIAGVRGHYDEVELF